MSFCWHHPNWKCIVGCIVITVISYMCGLPSRLDFLSYYFAALNHIVWKHELFDVICDKIVVARIHESSNIYLMLWQLDAKHVAIATEKEADTERCVWKTSTTEILQCHQQSPQNYAKSLKGTCSGVQCCIIVGFRLKLAKNATTSQLFFKDFT